MGHYPNMASQQSGEHLISQTITAAESPWKNKFMLLSGVILLTAGTAITAVCAYTFFTGSGDKSDKDYQPESSWIVFATGLLLLTLGFLLLIMGWTSHGQKRSAPNWGNGFSPLEHRTSSGGEDMLVKPTASLPYSRKNEGENVLLQDLQTKQTEGSGYTGGGPQPINAVNQQSGLGGTKHAPIAHLDEFDYSLRSSMNSVWSQYVNQQIKDSDDDDDSSFQSVVLQ